VPRHGRVDSVRGDSGCCCSGDAKNFQRLKTFGSADIAARTCGTAGDFHGKRVFYDLRCGWWQLALEMKT